MPFKPFRPPLIRKPPQVPLPSNKEDQPPTKRRRISDGDAEEGGDNVAKPKVPGIVVSDQQQPKTVKPCRKPLVPLAIPPPANHTAVGDTSGNDKGDGEAYFNVLWYVYHCCNCCRVLLLLYTSD